MEQGGSEAGGSDGGGTKWESEGVEGERRIERKGVATLISSLDYLVGALVLFFSLRAACPSHMPGEA
jgi:hypothetical protein